MHYVFKMLISIVTYVYWCGFLGSYEIRVAYCCIEVSPCAFIAKAWDACRVMLADVVMGEVGIESSFRGWIELILL